MEKRFEGNAEIVLYGVSMGATIAVMTAGLTSLSPSVKAVVADCAFTSPYDVFAHILKSFRDYSTLDAVQATGVPILFIHGKDDDFVPVWMSEKNYKMCRSPKDILIVDNAAHAASYYENKEAYEAKVKGFLEKYVG